MRKANVLILIDKFDYHGSYINGPTRYYSWLVKRIDKDLFNVHLCSLRPKGESDRIFQGQHIEVLYLNAGKYDPFTLVKLIRLIQRQEIDLLHLTGYGASTFGRLAGSFCGIPTIIHEHWVDPNLGGVQRVLERSLSRFTTKAIAISNYSREFLIRKKGLQDSQIVVIPNGVPLERFRRATAASGLVKRQELGINEETKVIGMIGMLHHNKDHQSFIKAASLITAERPKTRFIIVGDGDLRGQLEQQVADLNLGSHILFLGHQDDIPAILHMLDIFVVASISETFPLSLLEAMAAKKAIISTDCGGPSEIIQDGVSGLIIPVQAPKVMAQKIIYLMDNPSKCELLSTNAQISSEKYDVQFTVERVQEVYKLVAGVR